MKTLSSLTILARLKHLSRAQLERIAKTCVVEAMPMSHLRRIANDNDSQGIVFFHSLFGRTYLERVELVSFVMQKVIKQMPLKKLCAWIKELADEDELEEVLDGCQL